MKLGIEGRVAIVHGAGGGLGSAIALALAEEGVKVVVCDISEEALEHADRLLAQTGSEHMTLVWDLADRNSLRKLDDVVAKLGTVDILVNNSGGPPPSKAHAVDRVLWASHFDSMVLSLISMADAVIPGMKERGWGRIITSASSGVIAPIPNLGISNTLRSALVGWSKTLASELGQFGITSNIIVPGRIATARIRQLDQARAKREGRPVEAVIADSVSTIPVGRYGKPDEYGAVATFLASERASYITGSIVRVDGGYIPNI
ncbi:SDR family oxidoreductase [Pandoraea terrigena]|uniref:3-oxoacyl-ACP reductase n=1 Tax=Pandoraea terrigena TaxID=2508292 RepID=A0A5E4VG86_9BURK|nr:SDR family oxidoreductase [Pandoraea terrigena]VVE09970.1 3-oxoacyl-ACP reductase [Pandoraea terrigena]